MRAATPGDWKTEPLPPKRAAIPLDLTFSPREMERIRAGLVPEEMEDKWFIYWKDDVLFLHRSWTGYCVYVVLFVADGEGGRATQADVNRDPEQYTETDGDRDARMISHLIDALLLDKDSEFPA